MFQLLTLVRIFGRTDLKSPSQHQNFTFLTGECLFVLRQRRRPKRRQRKRQRRTRQRRRPRGSAPPVPAARLRPPPSALSRRRLAPLPLVGGDALDSCPLGQQRQQSSTADSGPGRRQPAPLCRICLLAALLRSYCAPGCVSFQTACWQRAVALLLQHMVLLPCLAAQVCESAND